MPVADRDVTFVPERVIWQAVCAHVIENLLVGQVVDRVRLPAAIAPFERADTLAALGLVTTQTREPGVHAEFVQSTLRAQLETDPVLIELVRRATGKTIGA